MKCVILIGEDGGALWDVQDNDWTAQREAWWEDGYAVRVIPPETAIALAKKYKYSHLYQGVATETGGDEPYIPLEVCVRPTIELEAE